MDICGIVLGRPYLYDRKAIFYREKNQYHLFKDGIEYIVHAQHMKTSMSLISIGQMKMLVNVSKNFILMMIKVKGKDDDTYKSFEGGDPKHKFEMIKIISEYDEVF